MRWLVVAAVTVCTPLLVAASEPAVSAEGTVAPLVATHIEGPAPVLTVTVIPPQSGDASSVATVDLMAAGAVPPPPASVVGPIAAPASVAMLSKPISLDSEIRRAKRHKARKATQLSKSLLSRTARYQLALLVAKPRTGEPELIDIFGGKDAESGADATDFHVSYGRPRLAKVDDSDHDADISEAVKLRLLMARMRAVDARKMALAAEDPDIAVSDAVKLRLFMARMQAVDAHKKKFS